MTRYTRNAKEVLRDGKHFADCIDDSAARLISDALNERKGMPQTQPDLPLGDNGPLFDDPPIDGMLYGGPYQGTLIVSEHVNNVSELIGALDVERSYLGKPVNFHQVRQENDEYACSCGRRWDIAEGEDHP